MSTAIGHSADSLIQELKRQKAAEQEAAKKKQSGKDKGKTKKKKELGPDDPISIFPEEEEEEDAVEEFEQGMFRAEMLEDGTWNFEHTPALPLAMAGARIAQPPPMPGNLNPPRVIQFFVDELPIENPTTLELLSRYNEKAYRAACNQWYEMDLLSTYKCPDKVRVEFQVVNAIVRSFKHQRQHLADSLEIAKLKKIEYEDDLEEVRDRLDKRRMRFDVLTKEFFMYAEASPMVGPPIYLLLFHEESFTFFDSFLRDFIEHPKLYRDDIGGVFFSGGSVRYSTKKMRHATRRKKKKAYESDSEDSETDSEAEFDETRGLKGHNAVEEITQEEMMDTLHCSLYALRVWRAILTYREFDQRLQDTNTFYSIVEQRQQQEKTADVIAVKRKERLRRRNSMAAMASRLMIAFNAPIVEDMSDVSSASGVSFEDTPRSLDLDGSPPPGKDDDGNPQGPRIPLDKVKPGHFSERGLLTPRSDSERSSDLGAGDAGISNDLRSKHTEDGSSLASSRYLLTPSDLGSVASSMTSASVFDTHEQIAKDHVRQRKALDKALSMFEMPDVAPIKEGVSVGSDKKQEHEEAKPMTKHQQLRAAVLQMAEQLEQQRSLELIYHDLHRWLEIEPREPVVLPGEDEQRLAAIAARDAEAAGIQHAMSRSGPWRPPEVKNRKFDPATIDTRMLVARIVDTARERIPDAVSESTAEDLHLKLALLEADDVEATVLEPVMRDIAAYFERMVWGAFMKSDVWIDCMENLKRERHLESGEEMPLREDEKYEVDAHGHKRVVRHADELIDTTVLQDSMQRVKATVAKPALEAAVKMYKRRIFDLEGELAVTTQWGFHFGCVYAQRAYRGHAVRRDLPWSVMFIMGNMYEIAAGELQRWWRGVHMYRKVQHERAQLMLRATVLAQNYGRRFLARVRAKKQRQRLRDQYLFDCATRIQTMIRGLLGRRKAMRARVAEWEKRSAGAHRWAATTIQRLYRGHLARCRKVETQLQLDMHESLREHAEDYLKRGDMAKFLQAINADYTKLQEQVDDLRDREETQAHTFVTKVVQAREKEHDVAWEAFSQALRDGRDNSAGAGGTKHMSMGALEAAKQASDGYGLQRGAQWKFTGSNDWQPSASGPLGGHGGGLPFSNPDTNADHIVNTEISITRDREGAQTAGSALQEGGVDKHNTTMSPAGVLPNVHGKTSTPSTAPAAARGEREAGSERRHGRRRGRGRGGGRGRGPGRGRGRGRGQRLDGEANSSLPSPLKPTAAQSSRSPAENGTPSGREQGSMSFTSDTVQFGSEELRRRISSQGWDAKSRLESKVPENSMREAENLEESGLLSAAESPLPGSKTVRAREMATAAAAMALHGSASSSRSDTASPSSSLAMPSRTGGGGVSTPPPVAQACQATSPGSASGVGADGVSATTWSGVEGPRSQSSSVLHRPAVLSGSGSGMSPGSGGPARPQTTYVEDSEGFSAVSVTLGGANPQLRAVTFNGPAEQVQLRNKSILAVPGARLRRAVTAGVNARVYELMTEKPGVTFQELYSAPMTTKRETSNRSSVAVNKKQLHDVRIRAASRRVKQRKRAAAREERRKLWIAEGLESSDGMKHPGEPPDEVLDKQEEPVRTMTTEEAGRVRDSEFGMGAAAMFAGYSLIMDIPLGLDDSVESLLRAASVRTFVPSFLPPGTTPEEAFHMYVNMPPSLAKVRHQQEATAYIKPIVELLRKQGYKLTRQMLPISRLATSLEDLNVKPEVINMTKEICSHLYRLGSTIGRGNRGTKEKYSDLMHGRMTVTKVLKLQVAKRIEKMQDKMTAEQMEELQRDRESMGSLQASERLSDADGDGIVAKGDNALDAAECDGTEDEDGDLTAAEDDDDDDSVDEDDEEAANGNGQGANAHTPNGAESNGVRGGGGGGGDVQAGDGDAPKPTKGDDLPKLDAKTLEDMYLNTIRNDSTWGTPTDNIDGIITQAAFYVCQHGKKRKNVGQRGLKLFLRKLHRTRGDYERNMLVRDRYQQATLLATPFILKLKAAGILLTADLSNVALQDWGMPDDMAARLGYMLGSVFARQAQSGGYHEKVAAEKRRLVHKKKIPFHLTMPFDPRFQRSALDPYGRPARPGPIVPFIQPKAASGRKMVGKTTSLPPPDWAEWDRAEVHGDDQKQGDEDIKTGNKGAATGDEADAPDFRNVPRYKSEYRSHERSDLPSDLWEKEQNRERQLFDGTMPGKLVSPSAVRGRPPTPPPEDPAAEAAAKAKALAGKKQSESTLELPGDISVLAHNVVTHQPPEQQPQQHQSSSRAGGAAGSGAEGETAGHVGRKRDDEIVDIIDWKESKLSKEVVDGFFEEERERAKKKKQEQSVRQKKFREAERRRKRGLPPTARMADPNYEKTRFSRTTMAFRASANEVKATAAARKKAEQPAELPEPRPDSPPHSLQAFNVHPQGHSKLGFRPRLFRCTHCGESFGRLYTLRLHERSHDFFGQYMEWSRNPQTGRDPLPEEYATAEHLQAAPDQEFPHVMLPQNIHAELDRLRMQAMQSLGADAGTVAQANFSPS